MILDEIKKARTQGLIPNCNRTSWDTLEVVKLSDIEKIMGEMKCEKCKDWLKYKNIIGLGECRYLTAKTTIDIVDTKPDFFCSQFEVKE